jgi:hypothetical protein
MFDIFKTAELAMVKKELQEKNELLSVANQTIAHLRSTLTISLKRSYSSPGTNGEIFVENNLICYSIELPWNMNQVRNSCIPEGVYPLEKRYSEKYKHHIHILNVPNRSLILFHPANDAQTQLLGCIAPVTQLISPGKGSSSKIAFEKLNSIVYGALDASKKVNLHIYS